ncbi:MAG: hypothetical protein JZU64_00280 [Rhodoferax sp.]|jgi:hypothetical protein|nr:hypothetical protein [Rhodoferax sp.]
MTTPKQENQPVASHGQMPPGADGDIKGSLTALCRAALRARQVAHQTGTDLIVVRAGQVVRVSPRQHNAP